MKVRTRAPAKINWTLEVLGKRADGYHEIKSVMQTIDICDEVWASSAPDLLERSQSPKEAPPGSLVLRSSPHSFSFAGDNDPGWGPVYGESVTQAITVLDPDWRRGARVHLAKKIPVAAGVGGGSSDAAATLRTLDRLWDLGLEIESLAETGLQIGSDVPFFC